MELKPCPICGGAVKCVEVDNYWRVQCTKCPTEFGRYWFAKGQKQMLYKAWNRRVNDGI